MSTLIYPQCKLKCNRYVKGEPFVKGRDCTLCYLSALHSAEYKDKPGKPLCIHRGKSTQPPDGESPLRLWVICDHIEKPLGEKVCSCRGCGETCPKYESDDLAVKPFKIYPPCNHTVFDDQCIPCYHWKHNTNGYREKFGGDPSENAFKVITKEELENKVKLGKKMSLDVIPECKYQGEMLDECKVCGGNKKHVYRCNHPEMKYEKCTRGNPNSGFQTCNICPNWAE